MLRITQQTSSAAARSYYSTADYFTEGQELVGLWRGKGAEALGLAGTIKQSDWDALCDNFHPQTHQPLTARTKSQRRVGWDFTFSVPKSISLVYALTQDQRILDAFAASVDQTMADIESELQTRVRSGGRDHDRPSGNGVWGRFIHLTSRPVDGIPDPQLHAHCFLFNATHDSEEQRWKAAQIATIKRDANYYCALMHSRLAQRLVELGLPIERDHKGWRIGGFDAGTDAKFSRRTRQIDAKAKSLGITDPGEKAQLGAITRDGKNKHLSMDALRATWLAWLTPDESHTVQHLHRQMGQSASPTFSDEAARRAIDHAALHHLERESVVAERVLLATALNRTLGLATSEQVHTALTAAPLLRGQEEGREMLTASHVLEEEKRMVDYARQGRHSLPPLSPGAQAPDWFNPGQREALMHLCDSQDAVALLRGVAGAGKTTLLAELKKQVEAHGKQIWAFAPSSQASRGVLREAGFDSAETVSMLLTNPTIQQQVANQVILVDEAGQLGTRAMAKLFDLAKAANARIILSGDRYQHGSVERGAALRLLEQEAGLRSAALTEIIRQQDRYKEAVAYLSQGRTDAGFNAFDELKWVHEVADPRQRYERIAAEYLQATEAGKSVLVVSPTHAESQQVTTAIRRLLQREGKLAEQETSVLKLMNRNLTLAERQDAASYRDGDVVLFTQNAKGYRKGTRLTVGIDPIPLGQAERFSVYQPTELKVADGDQIRIMANGTTADGHRVSNGQVYQVERIAEDGTLTLANGWHLGRTFGQVDYGYCNTSHASQGKTKDRVIVAQSSDSFAASSREQFYVSVSRGLSQCSIYTDDAAGLLKAVNRSDKRVSATELLSRPYIHRQIRRQATEESWMPAAITERGYERAIHHR